MIVMSTQTVYEYMIEQKLLDKVLEACENDEHREAALKTAKKLCERMDPFIESLRKSCKTEKDREAILNAILKARGGQNAGT